MNRAHLFLTTLVVSAACIAITPADAEAQRRKRDLITREEILNSAQKEGDLYLLIKNLRPRFLEPPPGVRTLGGSSYMSEPLAVYVDGHRATGVDALKLIIASRVEEVRYLDPTQSEMEYGPTVNAGAVLVKMYEPPRRGMDKPPKPDSAQADTTKPPLSP